jgi:hypothetical protein
MDGGLRAVALEGHFGRLALDAVGQIASIQAASALSSAAGAAARPQRLTFVTGQFFSNRSATHRGCPGSRKKHLQMRTNHVQQNRRRKICG